MAIYLALEEQSCPDQRFDAGLRRAIVRGGQGERLRRLAQFTINLFRAPHTAEPTGRILAFPSEKHGEAAREGGPWRLR